MNSTFMQDFWLYCQCYETVPNHAYWAAMGLLGGVVNRKCFTKIGDIKIFTNLYICLVSPQGTGKTTVKSFAEKLFRDACPEIPVGPSQQSREDIVKFMASEQCIGCYMDTDGTPKEIRPYVFFVNELKNFVSYNPGGMIAFLTDIYDADEKFDASTLKRGMEAVPFPSLNILACETDEWIINNLKNYVISGGFSRRLVMVNEPTDPDPKPRVVITPQARDAILRVRKRLDVVKQTVGEYQWHPDFRKLYDEWYIHTRTHLPDDPVFRGYCRSKHVQLLKVAMLLTASNPGSPMILTPETFVVSKAMLDAIEVNMPKLFVGAGRNELAAPMQHVLEAVRVNTVLVDGKTRHGMSKKSLFRLMEKELNPQEQNVVLDYLRRTDQVFLYTEGTREFVLAMKDTP